jgi:WD40 repeat protein
MRMKVNLFKSNHISHYLDGVTSLVVTSDNRFVISASYDKSLKIFDLHTKQQVHHFENIHEERILSVTITSVFDLHTKQQVHHYQNAHKGKSMYFNTWFLNI